MSVIYAKMKNGYLISKQIQQGLVNVGRQNIIKESLNHQG